MINKRKLLRISAKLMLWLTGILVFLFALLWLVLKVPSVQNFLVSKATSYVSKKTHTRVELKHIDLGFPTSILLQGLFLEDQQHDTLLSLHELEVNINMLGLLHKNIDVQDIELKELYVRLRRSDKDSSFNFQFLLDAFVGKEEEIVVEDTATGTPWEISAKAIALQKCRFDMIDSLSGTTVFVSVGTIETEIDDLDLEQSSVVLGDIRIDEVHGALKSTKAPAPDTDTTSGGWNGISLANLSIERSSFTYTDLISSMSVAARIGALELQETAISLLDQTIKGEGLTLAQSSSIIQLKKDTLSAVIENETKAPEQASDKGWSVHLEELDMKGNAFRMDYTNQKALPAGIDWNHLSLSGIQTSIKNIVYEGPLIKADIASLAAQEKSGFGIRSLETKAYMDATKAELQDLSLATNNSYIGQHIKVQYKSLEELMSSLTLDCSMYNNHIAIKDLLLLAPDLDKVDIIHKNKSRSLVLNLNANGDLDQLNIKQLTLQALSTNIDVSGQVRHALEPDKLFLDVRIKNIGTGSADLAALLPATMVPSSIQIPSSVYLKGDYKGTLADFKTTMDLHSSIGNALVHASIHDLPSEKPSYDLALNAHSFDLGKLLGQQTLGQVTGIIDAKGIGFKPETAIATIKADVQSIGLNQYNYHAITLDGQLDKGLITAKADVADTNLILALNGKVNLNKDKEYYDVKVDLKGADFYGLGLTKDHISLSANTDVYLIGDPASINGHVAVRDILVVKNGKKYKTDSLVFVSLNETGNSKVSLNSSMVAASFQGNIDLLTVASSVSNHLNRYFRFTNEAFKETKPQNFQFEFQLNDSPLLREVILPSLTNYSPMYIKGGFNSSEAKLTLDVDMPFIEYNKLIIRDLDLVLDSDKNKLSYNTGWSNFKSSGLTLQQTILNGAIAHDTVGIALQIKNEESEEKLMLRSRLTRMANLHYRFSIEKDGLALQGKKWEVSDKNYLEFAKDYLFADKLKLSHETQSLSLQSSEGGKNMALTFSKFDLHTFSQIAEQDTLLVQGVLDGNVMLKNVLLEPAFTSELRISKLAYKESNIGNLHITADNLIEDRYTAKVVLTDSLSNATISGYYLSTQEKNALNFNADIQSIQLASLEAFSNGQISGSSGLVKGNVTITGAVKDPKFDGNIQFIDVATKVAFLNQRLFMNKETISLSHEKVSFQSFNIKDSLNNEAVIDGYVGIKSLDDISFHLNVTTKDFLVMNTTALNNKLYYGKVILDSKIRIQGTPNHPDVNADLKIVGGSHFTFAVPESKVSVDRGEGIVVFRNDSSSLDPIMLRQEAETQIKKYTGFDIAARISINKNSSLKLLIDPISGDSLSLRGNAALNFKMDATGQTMLTGQYIITEGTYKASLENLLVRNFEIKKGSNIIWTGDPLDALVDITALYNTRTAPEGLFGNVSVTDSTALRRPLPFIVLLKMKGELLKPVISFELDMPDNEKGAIGGEVYAKLGTINSNESELNKQVFALLVLNRFIAPDNSGSGGDASSFARRSVSRMMSNELNKLSAKYVKGLEIDVDVQSYNDVNNGQQQGNTQVQLGATKTLFDERLSVQVGGNVNVEGQDATANSNVKNFTGDVAIEYKLTKNGRYRLKGFRTNQYDNVSNGTIIETGIGIMFIRNYNHTKDLFSSKKKK